MNQPLNNQLNTYVQRVDRALLSLKHGQGVLLIDDDDRENEADLIFAAETITEKQMAMLIRECSGIVCLCLTDETLQTLDLPMMVSKNTSHYGTAFTISIEAAEGVSTGVSAADRVTTIQTAIANQAKPTDLRWPGHVFPLRARPGGVLSRRGHTEGVIDLMKLAQLKPAGVLCELMNADGTMANQQEILRFSNAHHMPIVSIEDIVRYRQDKDACKTAL
ncbi:3,4-dihydroxy-2-butanone-4-phosphate synthase [Spartinivicinus ruber]|uniref:3,4-dihydroxy-2-butanone-4-phosphate synthase n=1 Tax=Spartinivicinus ruber TaxID=2683272 RepID=UPI0013D2AEB8|nr:3,4-dihydroxy-2-butanone-4-phosphate synthase [Spartinivicinus ruber]